MPDMDLVVGTFPEATDAVSAATELRSRLGLEDEFVAVDHVERGPGGAGHPAAADAVVLAYVPDEARTSARDVIGRHHGRHVPIDWLAAIQEEVDPRTVPLASAQVPSDRPG